MYGGDSTNSNGARRNPYGPCIHYTVNCMSTPSCLFHFSEVHRAPYTTYILARDDTEVRKGTLYRISC